MSKKGLRKPAVVEEKTFLSLRVADLVSARVINHRTGREDEFYRIDFPDWVNVIALTRDRRMVLIRQYRFGSGDIELEIPGGAVEEGEDPVNAGQRELLEETGYRGDNPRIIGEVCPNPAIQGNRCYTLLVEDAEPVAGQDQDEMEDIEVSVVPLVEIDALVDNGTICHGLVLNALMFHERYRKRNRLG